MTGTARVSAFTVLLVLATLEAGAQDSGLPPGILLLSRVKRHVKQELEHLPEYTCLETVQRFGLSAANMREKPKAGKKEQPGGKFQLDPIDTVRLEILYSGNKELYSSPGGSHFREENLSSFVVGGDDRRRPFRVPPSHDFRIGDRNLHLSRRRDSDA